MDEVSLEGRSLEVMARLVRMQPADDVEGVPLCRLADETHIDVDTLVTVTRWLEELGCVRYRTLSSPAVSRVFVTPRGREAASIAIGRRNRARDAAVQGAIDTAWSRFLEILRSLDS